MNWHNHYIYKFNSNFNYNFQLNLSLAQLSPSLLKLHYCECCHLIGVSQLFFRTIKPTYIAQDVLGLAQLSPSLFSIISQLTCWSDVLYSLQYICIASTGTVCSIARQYKTVLLLIMVLTILYCVAILANTVLDMQLSYKGGNICQEHHTPPTTPAIYTLFCQNVFWGSWSTQKFLI